MILIYRNIMKQMIAHAKKVYPVEACGYLVGNNNVITKCYEMQNIDNSEEHFSFDIEEQFKVMKESRNAGQSILANYHSHPKTPSRPSEEDIRLAFDSEILYFIISLKEQEPVIKAFKIKSGLVEEEKIEII